MREIQYTPELKIRNIEQLKPGTGAKFLLCILSIDDELVAKQWLRTAPRKVMMGNVLVRF